jgi:hypothetical protein
MNSCGGRAGGRVGVCVRLSAPRRLASVISMLGDAEVCKLPAWTISDFTQTVSTAKINSRQFLLKF